MGIQPTCCSAPGTDRLIKWMRWQWPLARFRVSHRLLFGLRCWLVPGKIEGFGGVDSGLFTCGSPPRHLFCGGWPAVSPSRRSGRCPSWRPPAFLRQTWAAVVLQAKPTGPDSCGLAPFCTGRREQLLSITAHSPSRWTVLGGRVHHLRSGPPTARPVP